MDIFERKTVTADLTDHGCPGVSVTFRQLSNADLRTLTDEPTGDQVEALLAANVVAIGGLNAGGEAVTEIARLLELADDEEAIPEPVAAILRGIGTELIRRSRIPGADLGNSEPLSASGGTGSDGTAPNA